MDELDRRTKAAILDEYGQVKFWFPKGFEGSHHRALGVLLEEFEELKAELFKRPADRDREKIRKEACQVAVTAILIMEELG